MGMNVAIVGATGAVGREMLQVLEQRAFPANRVTALASPRSAGVRIPFRGRELTVEPLSTSSFSNVGIALFSAGASTSREFAPVAARAGAVVIDNSSAWRMDPECPLVVPEVNPKDIQDRPKGIIANPNCSTIQMVVALKPLHDAAGLRRVIVSTYQAASGKGQKGADELMRQAEAHALGTCAEPSVFPSRLAFNVISDWPAGVDDYSEEEWKLVRETRKILNLPSLGVSPTTARVPVVHGHAESVYAEFERPLPAAEAKELLRKAPGVQLVDTPYAPGNTPEPLHAAGKDAVFVGRVRNDLAVPGALKLWIVADNLRKGAALNAVQIAELLQTD